MRNVRRNLVQHDAAQSDALGQQHGVVEGELVKGGAQAARRHGDGIQAHRRRNLPTTVVTSAGSAAQPLAGARAAKEGRLRAFSRG